MICSSIYICYELNLWWEFGIFGRQFSSHAMTISFLYWLRSKVKCLPCDHYKLRVMILNWKRHTSWNCAECCHRLLRVFPWIIAAVFPLAISCKANWILTYLYSSFIVRITSSRVLHVNKLRSILINHVIFSHLSHLLW